jgi:hypothetical protein
MAGTFERREVRREGKRKEFVLKVKIVGQTCLLFLQSKHSRG